MAAAVLIPIEGSEASITGRCRDNCLWLSGQALLPWFADPLALRLNDVGRGSC